MNKVKKLQKGMTLVEIVVAMSIFSIGTAAVTMAFAGAVKYNVHNQRRDAELSIQQDELQRGKADGLEIYGGHVQDSEIVFTPSGGTEIKFKKSDGSIAAKPFMNVTEYQAVRSGKNDTKFDFQLKTFSTTPLGSDKLVQKREDDQYKISVINTSTVNYDVDITIDAGTLYQGDISSGSGYKHASPLFHQSLAPTGTTYTTVDGGATPVQHAPDTFEIGYIRTGMASIPEADSPMTISFSKEGFIYKQIKVSPAGLTEGMGDPSSTKTGWCEVTIQDGGKITYAYK